MIDLMLAIKSATLAMSVAKYMGIVQDKLALKIDQLAGSELESGLRALQQAANSESEQQFLLREARARFNKAVSLEKGLRLAATYVGLALCHVNLGDAINAERAIRDLTLVTRPEPSNLVATTKTLTDGMGTPGEVVRMAGYVLGGWIPKFVKSSPPVIVARVMTDVFIFSEEARFDAGVATLLEIQKQANQLLKQSLIDGSENVFGLIQKDKKKSRWR